MVMQLDCDDPGITIWRIAYDIGEIAIEGKQDATEFLSFGNDDRVGRANGKMVPQQQNLMPMRSQRPNDLVRDALIGEKPDFHAPTASKSAKSLA